MNDRLGEVGRARTDDDKARITAPQWKNPTAVVAADRLLLLLEDPHQFPRTSPWRKANVSERAKNILDMSMGIIAVGINILINTVIGVIEIASPLRPPDRTLNKTLHSSEHQIPCVERSVWQYNTSWVSRNLEKLRVRIMQKLSAGLFVVGIIFRWTVHCASAATIAPTAQPMDLATALQNANFEKNVAIAHNLTERVGQIKAVEEDLKKRIRAINRAKEYGQHQTRSNVDVDVQSEVIDPKAFEAQMKAFSTRLAANEAEQTEISIANGGLSQPPIFVLQPRPYSPIELYTMVSTEDSG